jgi:hypothetical protein
MNIKASVVFFASAFIVLPGALSCGRGGGGRDILPIDPDIDLHMTAVERSFEKVYTSFTMLRQDYNDHLSRHFESREVQFDSLGEEIVDTTSLPAVIDCPFTAYCGLDNVTYAPPSDKMPVSQRTGLLDEKLGYLTGCVKKYAELYYGHLEACHGAREKNEVRLSYKHLSDGLAQPTAVRILDGEVRELDTLVAALIRDFNEHMNGHW